MPEGFLKVRYSLQILLHACSPSNHILHSVHGRRLQELPRSITQLTSLRLLNLAHNPLEVLLAGMGALCHLQDLQVCGMIMPGGPPAWNPFSLLLSVVYQHIGCYAAAPGPQHRFYDCMPSATDFSVQDWLHILRSRFHDVPNSALASSSL